MNNLWPSLGVLTTALAGFLIALGGVAKADDSHFANNTSKEVIFFGNRTSPVDVYVFTDWYCPACRKVEPVIEKNAPDIAHHARLFFIDTPIHDKSMNFTPYNLSFMLKDKAKYLILRHKLDQLSMKNDKPTEEDIKLLAQGVGADYYPLDYSEVNLGIKYFKDTVSEFNVTATPTVVIVNPSTKKSEKLVGIRAIKDADFDKLIQKLSK